MSWTHVNRRLLRLLDLDADSACPDGLMHAREPQLLFPPQAERLTEVHELSAVVRAAVPQSAGPGARKVVLGRQQKHPPAAAHHPCQLGEAHPSVRQMLEDITASHAVER